MSSTLLADNDQLLLEAPVRNQLLSAQQEGCRNNIVVPEWIQRYQRIWEEHLAAFEAYKKSIAAIARYERESDPEKESWQYFTDEPEPKTLEKLHESMVLSMCRMAEKSFSAPGSTLKIEETNLEDCLAAKYETFDPAEVWSYLQKKYDTDEGKAASYRIASDALSQAVEFHRWGRRGEQPKEVRVISGRPVLTVNLYGGEWRYNFSGREQLVKFLNALRCVSMWGELWNPEDQEAFEAIINKVSGRDVADPRGWGRIDYWPLAVMVGFKEKVEFRISPGLAEKIQVFRATYGRPEAD